MLSFSQLSRLQQRLGIGAEIGSVALDWLSLLLCCFIYVAVWHESSGPLSRRATAPRIRAVLSAVGCGLAPLAPRKVRTVDERGEGQWLVDVSVKFRPASQGDTDSTDRLAPALSWTIGTAVRWQQNIYDFGPFAGQPLSMCFVNSNCNDATVRGSPGGWRLLRGALSAEPLGPAGSLLAPFLAALY